MPSVSENLKNWSADWEWSQSGEEWSQWWGGTPALWHGALLPRIHAMIPTATILEIAPGYGRWTQYLKDVCDRLVIVDLTEDCIEHCQGRFATATNIEYHVNDGRSLAMVADRSVDFAFSFDSLVHADPDVIAGYLEQLSHKLKPEGIGFIHHSNAGAYAPMYALARRVPSRLLGRLVRTGALVNVFAWRDESMTAATFAGQCAQAGMVCITQEMINWEFGPYLIDTLSVFTRLGSRWEHEPRIVRNPLFVAEAHRMARLYARRPPPRPAPDAPPAAPASDETA